MFINTTVRREMVLFLFFRLFRTRLSRTRRLGFRTPEANKTALFQFHIKSALNWDLAAVFQFGIADIFALITHSGLCLSISPVKKQVKNLCKCRL